MAFVVIIMVILLVIGLALSMNQRDANAGPLLDKNDKEVSVNRMGILGTHLHGLGVGERIVLCLLTETDFLFAVSSPTREVLEQFPHKNLKAIEVQDAKQMSRRITATRLAALGPFALAVPKTEVNENAYLLIEWEDETGLRQAVFSETGPGALGRADMHAARIRRLLKEVLVEQADADPVLQS